MGCAPVKNQSDRTLPLSKQDVSRVLQAGFNDLVTLVIAALSDEAAADLVDYDNLIGFGRQCGSLTAGLDSEALIWAKQRRSERGLDVLCGFLMGYWMELRALDGLRPELLAEVLVLRSQVPLKSDSATASVSVVGAGLVSREVSPEQREILAGRLLEIIDAEPQYRHEALVRHRLLKLTGRA